MQRLLYRGRQLGDQRKGPVYFRSPIQGWRVGDMLYPGRGAWAMVAAPFGRAPFGRAPFGACAFGRTCSGVCHSERAVSMTASPFGAPRKDKRKRRAQPETSSRDGGMVRRPRHSGGQVYGHPCRTIGSLLTRALNGSTINRCETASGVSAMNRRRFFRVVCTCLVAMPFSHAATRCLSRRYVEAVRGRCYPGCVVASGHVGRLVIGRWAG